jgi:hypothetical protein
MSEILTDAKYTHVDLTRTLSVNEHVVLDNNLNMNVNDIVCNRLYYQQLLSSTLLEDTQSLDRGFKFIPELANTPDTSHNECDGLYSVTIGGFNNEVYGDASVTLGGCDNQCVGQFTTAMGVNSVAKHDHCMVWNGDKGTNVCTTNTNQIVFNATNGMHFRLPLSNTVWDEHLANGFACFCWDSATDQMCVKTKQNDVVYKCSLHSPVHEIAVKLAVTNDDIELTLKNPDNH